MKVSTKGVYAIEAMIDLAYYSRENVASIKDIAQRRSLSEKYLEQIMGKLRKENIIESVRGAGGGYRLLKAPEQISVYDILCAVEGDLAPVECLTQDSSCGMDCDLCASRKFWNGMWRQITSHVQRVNLGQLMEQYERNLLVKEPEYYL